MYETHSGPTTPIAHDLLRESIDPRIILINGYDIRITVRSRQLLIEDGITTGRRTRIVSRADGVKRLVILTDNGFVSLQAHQWCHDEGIAISMYDRFGTLIMSACPADDSNPHIRMTQAVIAAGGMESFRADTVKSFLAAKLEGQAYNAVVLFDRHDVASLIDEYARHLDKSITIKELLGWEGKAAQCYWNIWKDSVSISWTSTRHIPEHWTKPYPGRANGTKYETPSHRFNRNLDDPTPGNRGANDPINALLNYSYRIAETEAINACNLYGLDPSFGFAHSVRPNRNALALDLLECVRSLADRIVLDLIRSVKFQRRWMLESQHGVVRLGTPIPGMLCEHSLEIARAIQPHVASLANELASLRVPMMPLCVFSLSSYRILGILRIVVLDHSSHLLVFRLAYV